MTADEARLVADLLALPLPSGRDLLVHASLRQLDVAKANRPATFLRALQHVLGPDGTVVVYTSTAGNSTTSPAFRAATAGLDRTGVSKYIDAMKGFDPTTTPGEDMGAFSEYVRKLPGTVRSTHPQTSFAALGPRAASLMSDHQLDCHLGDRSPLGALYRADATVLLLGLDYDNCTAFHLAEYQVPSPPVRGYTAFVQRDGRRVREDFLAVDLNDHDFNELGTAVEPALRQLARGRIGNVNARAFPLRAAVHAAIGWLTEHRQSYRS